MLLILQKLILFYFFYIIIDINLKISSYKSKNIIFNIIFLDKGHMLTQNIKNIAQKSKNGKTQLLNIFLIFVTKKSALFI